VIATTVLSAAQTTDSADGARSRSFGQLIHAGGARRLIGIVLLIAVWEVLSATGVLSPQTLASPANVLSTGRHLIADGELQSNLWVSLHRVFWGLLLGVSLGLVLAVFSGLSHIGEAVVDGPMQIFRALPILALQPLFIVWFGIGEEMKIVLIAFAVAFPVYINTYAGIRGVDQRFVELAHGVRLKRRQLIRRVVLPGALPNFLVGLRFSLAIAWLVLILSEEVNATSGIGYMITQAGLYGETNVIVVGLAVYGVLGLLSDILVRVLERYALAWRRGLIGS
jgi:sulfonate transport system permease protein